MRKNTLESKMIKKAQDRIDFTGRCIMRIMHNEELSDVSKSSIIHDYYSQAEDYIEGLSDAYRTMARYNDTFDEETYDKLCKFQHLMMMTKYSHR